MSWLLSILLATNVAFSSPVNYEIALAGNFGEPRPNHFHGGIDIKTGGVEGKPIFSIGDGYISHVSVGIGGFGNAVYVHHPEGYTSVYCHLKKFVPQIAAMVRKWQYAHHSYVGDMHFAPTDLPVAKGQLIAVSGNSGSSQAPHLHLEIHNTRTWEMLDPLDFIGVAVKDKLPPMAHGFMVYPQPGEGMFCGGSSKQSFPFTSHDLTRKFTAWGKVGFGIWANDYMEITYNRYGVRKTELFVDDHLVFSSDISRVPVDDNRMVNAWGDYEHFLRYNVWYMRSFIYPGVTLPCMSADSNRGLIDFDQERDYHITYSLTDFKGNNSRYTFTVTGKRTAIAPSPERHPLRTLYWNQTNYVQLPGMQIVIPSGCLADHCEVHPKIGFRPGALSDDYQLMPRSFPLFHYAKISLRLKHAVKDPSKLYIVSRWGTDRYMGGTYQDGWITGHARELGATYRLSYDETPPIITPITVNRWATSHILQIGLQDKESGVASYEGYIDGKFVLFEEVPKSPWVRCDLAQTPIKKTGQMHRLTFIVTDNRANKRVFTTQIKY